MVNVCKPLFFVLCSSAGFAQHLTIAPPGTNSQRVLVAAASSDSANGAGAIRITFSQQGTEVLRSIAGTVPPSIGVASADICVSGDTSRIVPAGEIYDAARLHGISTISPLLAAALLDRQKNRNRVQISLDLLSLASGVSGTLGTTKVIGMPKGVATGLSLAPVVIPLVTPLFTKRLPADQSLRANLLQTDVGVTAHSCQERLLLFLFKGYWEPRIEFLP